MSFHCFASTWSIYWKKRVGFPERTSLVSSSCTLSKMLWTICTSLSVISSAGLKLGSKSPQFPAVSVPVETCELKLLGQQAKKKNYVATWHQASGFSKSSFFSSADISAWELLQNMIHTLVINHMAFENPRLVDDFTIQIAIFFRDFPLPCVISGGQSCSKNRDLVVSYILRQDFMPGPPAWYERLLNTVPILSWQWSI